MKIYQFLLLTIIFMVLSSLDTKINSALINLNLVFNLTYLFLCFLCFMKPEKINSFFGAYIGFLIDLHQNVFFGLHAALFSLTILVINYNYFRLRMFSIFQVTITFSLFTSFFVGFKTILLSTMNFQYMMFFLSFFCAFITYLFIPHLGNFIAKKIKI